MNVLNFPPSAVALNRYFHKHALTPDDVAMMLHYSKGNSARQVRRWLKGTHAMPYTAWFTLRTLVENEQPEYLNA